MKLIQIFAIAATLAITASAQEQNSSNQNAAPTTQPKVVEKKTDTKKKSEKTTAGKDAKPSATTPIQVTVPQSGSKPGSAPAAKAGSTTAKPVTAVKSSAAETKSSTAATKAGTKTNKPAAAQKTGPVISVVPQAASKTAPAKTAAANAAAAKATPAPAKTAQKVPVIAVTSPAKSQTAPTKTSTAAKSASAQKDVARKPVAVAPGKTPFAPKAVAGGKPVVAQKKVEPKVVEAKSAAPAKDAKDAKDAPKPVAKLSASGHRDPFISPVRNLSTTPTGPNCSTGKKCLFIPELVVQGTVKDNQTGEMMAVVVNRARHTYFLRQNDQVFNGNVEKITSDSVIFREFATDNLGRESAHEVVKRVSPVS